MCCLLDKTQTIVIFQDDLGKTGTRMLNHSGFPAPRDDGGGGWCLVVQSVRSPPQAYQYQHLTFYRSDAPPDTKLTIVSKL